MGVVDLFILRVQSLFVTVLVIFTYAQCHAFGRRRTGSANMLAVSVFSALCLEVGRRSQHSAPSTCTTYASSLLQWSLPLTTRRCGLAMGRCMPRPGQLMLVCRRQCFPVCPPQPACLYPPSASISGRQCCNGREKTPTTAAATLPVLPM